jgi:hypothetical protein
MPVSNPIVSRAWKIIINPICEGPIEGFGRITEQSLEEFRSQFESQWGMKFIPYPVDFRPLNP